MSYQLLVDGKEFWSDLKNEIRGAEKSVYIQTLSFEADDGGQPLIDELLQLDASIDKRLIIDRYTRFLMNDRFLFSPKSLADSELQSEKRRTFSEIKKLQSTGTQIKWVNPLGPLLLRICARNHRKIIVVDDRCAYIGGVNFSGHNFEWHDIMLKITDPKEVAFLKDDFLATWENWEQHGRKTFEQADYHLLDGPNSEKVSQRLFELIDSAEKSIHVYSPYLSFPFYSPLTQASTRGVDVHVIAPAKNNWGLYDAYTSFENSQGNVNLWLYPGKMLHLKSILIDDRYLVVGSSNFDFFSIKTHQEIFGIFEDPRLIEDFKKRVLEADLKVSTKREPSASSSPKYQLAHWALKGLFYFLVALNRLLPQIRRPQSRPI